MARALLALVLLASACTGGDRGAVVVRWRITDSTTGSPASGGCGTACAGKSYNSSFCCASIGGHDVIIDGVELVAIPLGSDGGAAVADCKSCRFACNPPESTTQFELRPGDYLLSLRALRCGAVVGDTPPGVIHTVRAGEITNLNAIQILLTPPAANAPISCGGADGGAAMPVCQ